MEEEKWKETRVEILTAMPYEGSNEKSIENMAVQFQNSKIYIWSCQEISPLLMSDQGSLVKESADMTINHAAPNQDEGQLSTKRKPMGERIKNETEDMLKEVARDNLKSLMRIIDTNLIIDKVDKSLNLNEFKSFGDDN